MSEAAARPMPAPPDLAPMGSGSALLSRSSGSAPTVHSDPFVLLTRLANTGLPLTMPFRVEIPLKIHPSIPHHPTTKTILTHGNGRYDDCTKSNSNYPT